MPERGTSPTVCQPPSRITRRANALRTVMPLLGEQGKDKAYRGLKGSGAGQLRRRNVRRNLLGAVVIDRNVLEWRLRACQTAKASSKTRRTGQPFAGDRRPEGHEGLAAQGVRGLRCLSRTGVAPHGGAADPSGTGRPRPGPDRAGQGLAVLDTDR